MFRIKRLTSITPSPVTADWRKICKNHFEPMYQIKDEQKNEAEWYKHKKIKIRTWKPDYKVSLSIIVLKDIILTHAYWIYTPIKSNKQNKKVPCHVLLSSADEMSPLLNRDTVSNIDVYLHLHIHAFTLVFWLFL